MKKIILAAVLSVLALGTHADDSKWRQLVSSKEGAISFMPSSYAEDALGFRYMWVRVEYAKPKGKTYKDDLLFIADCPARKLGATQIISYGKSGKEIANTKLPQYLAPMETVPPDGFEYVMLEGICGVP